MRSSLLSSPGPDHTQTHNTSGTGVFKADPNGVTYLDPPETSGIHGLSYRGYRMLSVPAGEMEATIETLTAILGDASDEELDPPPWGTRIDRLRECRTRAYFACHAITHEVKVYATTCKDRWCPLCSAARASRIAAAVRDWCGTINQPKLLTLTIASSNVPLRDQIDRLIKSFNTLRRDDLLKDKLRGGIWFFQVTWSPDRKQWHPHIHAVVDCDYIRQRYIANRWEQITKDSRVVDIRTVKDAKSAARYVARYVARPAMLSELPSPQRIEIVTALKGVRLVNTFGNAHKAGLLKKEPLDRSLWVRLGSWSVITAIASIDSHARHLLECWRKRIPYYLGTTWVALDNEIDGIITVEKPPPKPRQEMLEFAA